tara:strand:+ start:306 stop:644 length:339 start_codon:yes stop_codon:yes gene_type:complete
MNNNLSKLKCKPCSGKTEKLRFNEISDNLKKIKNWNVNDQQEMIYKKFNFKNFKNTLNFVNIVGKIAEEEGHHPDISLGWGYCLIMIHTHAIKGLSINDFILASKIDLIENN